MSRKFLIFLILLLITASIDLSIASAESKKRMASETAEPEETEADLKELPLTGVWANFPYLHNGSVPTLYHLLSPEAERPKMFHVLSAKHFDPEKVGQKLFPDDLNQNVLESELMKKYGDNRDWFNVDRKGCKNVGHDFWSRIKTDSNRKALIEYLKTL